MNRSIDVVAHAAGILCKQTSQALLLLCCAAAGTPSFHPLSLGQRKPYDPFNAPHLEGGPLIGSPYWIRLQIAV